MATDLIKVDKNSLVEYSNEFAESINDYSAKEFDLVLTMAYIGRKLVPDHKHVSIDENLILQLPLTAIKKIIQGNRSTERLKESLEKIFDSKVYFKKDNFTKVRHLFEALDFSNDGTFVEFELKKEFIPLFFNLTEKFTRHEILEFTSLKGKYSKSIYQIVMMYKSFGSKEFSASEFRLKLAIPDNYSWSDVEVKIMERVKKEFEVTKIKKIELKRIKEGRAITKVKLVWEFHEVAEVTEVEKDFYSSKKQEIKKEDIEEAEIIEVVEPVELTPEEEEKGIKKMLADGMDKNYIELMRKNSKTMFVNMVRELLKGVE